MRSLRSIPVMGPVLLLCFCFSSEAADFSIVLAGSANYCFLRDINRGTDGYLDYWSDLLSLGGGLANKNREPVHLVMNYSLDLVLPTRSDYKLVIGAGYMRANNRSDVMITYTDGTPETSALVETAVEAVPIKLCLLREFPLGRSVNAFVEGGVGIYITRFTSRYRPAGPGNSHLQTAHSIGVGALYGVGLEIKAFRNVSLVLEGKGNYARIGHLNGTRQSSGSTLPDEEKGALYFENRTYIPPDAERTYPIIMIEENRSEGDGIRRARVDLSGFAISVGLKIDF